VEKRYDEAETFCRASVDVRPNYHPAVNGMGVIHFGRGDFAQAELDFTKAVSLMPGSAGDYSNLALSQVFLGKTDDAEATLEKAARLSDANYPPAMFIPALRSLAIAYSEQQNYQKVFENLSRILYLSPADAEARIDLTSVLIKLRRFDEAQVHIEAITRADPSNAQARNLYGLVLMGKAQNVSAAEQFEAAWRLKPDFEEARSNLKKAKGEK
jgi:Flp pilus assembly protein TadD